MVEQVERLALVQSVPSRRQVLELDRHLSVALAHKHIQMLTRSRSRFQANLRPAVLTLDLPRERELEVGLGVERPALLG